MDARPTVAAPRVIARRPAEERSSTTSLPSGKLSRRQATVPTRILSDKPCLPAPGHSKPSLPNRANLLQTRYCAAAAPKAQPGLTAPSQSFTWPRHADAILSHTFRRPRHRPGTTPSRHPARIGRFRPLFRHIPLPTLQTLPSSDFTARNRLPHTPTPTSSPTPKRPHPHPRTATAASVPHRLLPPPSGPGTKKTPAPLKVRASVLPNNRRITSRSSRRSPWRPSERPDRRCRRGSSSRPKR